MVNASLNWASIVGIVLAVGGAFLYFMRSFKPALARDYDVFFAAVGLLCGGILFFQGWRLDPILQFGQFLLASTTVFFAYESVRLRGITTDQARRSSFFEDEEPSAPYPPRGGLGGSPAWENEVDRFDAPGAVRRRIRSRDEYPEEDDFYRPRRSSRAAIPERAASRRSDPEEWEEPRRGRDPEPTTERSSSYPASSYSAGGYRGRSSQEFGSRRRDREMEGEIRRGSRPAPSPDTMPRSSRRPAAASGRPDVAVSSGPTSTPGVPQGTPIRSASGRSSDSQVSDADFSPLKGRRTEPPVSGSSAHRAADTDRDSPSRGTAPRDRSPRDNDSRFDD